MTLSNRTANIPIPRVVFGKRKARSQMCLITTDDGRILPTELEVLRGCIDNVEKSSAFLIDKNNQMRGEDGQMYQILSERSIRPIAVVKEREPEDLTKRVHEIFAEAVKAAIHQQFLNALKNTLMDKLMWIISIPCVTFGFIFILNKFW